MTKDIIIHTGLPKTGSTFLQKAVFTKLKDVYYTGVGIKREKDPFNYIFSQIYYSNLLLTDTETVKKTISDFMENLEESEVLFSREALCGYAGDNFRTYLLNTIFLKKLFPEAKIFFVFRKQDEWLESYYIQTIREGLSTPVDKFLNYENGKFLNSKTSAHHQINLEVNRFDWLKFIQYYTDTFGKENILALPYELLCENPNEFLNRFYSFSNIEPYFPPQNKVFNKKCSYVSANLMFHINKNFINDEKRALIMDYYKEPNKKLAEFVNMDLSQYGYY